MEQISEQIKVQEDIGRLVKYRQEQISELKLYYDNNNSKYYKDIVNFGQNLSKFENVFTKYQLRNRCENILSLALSLGKIIDLNNAVKTILIAIKIFEEHIMFAKNAKKKEGKTFITKLFEKNNSIPLSQNEMLKERVNITWDKSESFKKMANFYDALFKKDSNFFKDFNSYLTFQKDSKRKEENNFKMEDFNNKLDKIYSNSYSISNKFYNRINISFELDYASTVNSACDIFFMLYNKMMDKICYNSNLLPYITELDRYIVKEFIVPCKNDLIRLAEFIAESDIRSVDNELKKFFNH
jgi:hypothetical protein